MIILFNSTQFQEPALNNYRKGNKEEVLFPEIICEGTQHFDICS